MSSISPSTFGGTSRTSGPSRRSTQNQRVNRVVVGCQLDGARVHQVLPDRHGLIRRSHRQDCAPVRHLIDRRQAEQIRLHGALEVEVVVELLGGGLVRDAAVELKRAQARLDLVGHRDARRHRRGVLQLGIGRRAAEHLRQRRHGRQVNRKEDQ